MFNMFLLRLQGKFDIDHCWEFYNTDNFASHIIDSDDFCKARLYPNFGANCNFKRDSWFLFSEVSLRAN